jgi:hypothetical protein
VRRWVTPVVVLSADFFRSGAPSTTASHTSTATSSLVGSDRSRARTSLGPSSRTSVRRAVLSNRLASSAAQRSGDGPASSGGRRRLADFRPRGRPSRENDVADGARCSRLLDSAASEPASSRRLGLLRQWEARPTSFRSRKRPARAGRKSKRIRRLAQGTDAPDSCVNPSLRVGAC